MTFHYSTAEKRLLMIGSADSPSQTNRMIQLAPTSFIALARLSAITLSQQAQSAGKSHRLASHKDSQSIRLASLCLRVSRLTARNTEQGLPGPCWVPTCRALGSHPMLWALGRGGCTPSMKT